MHPVESEGCVRGAHVTATRNDDLFDLINGRTEALILKEVKEKLLLLGNDMKNIRTP